MNIHCYDIWKEKALSGELLTDDECLQILKDPEIELLPLLHSAYQVRKHYWGNEVRIHILNNVQNGLCSEDCSYCAQAKDSKASIEPFSMKSEAEILDEAKKAYESGAFRYCMVFSGKGPSIPRTKKIAELVKKIKDQYNIEVCVSAGIMSSEHTTILKEAGLDRLNHNLNTSSRNYQKICTTHTYEDRVNTLKAAKGSQLELCSGVIIGMEEDENEIISLAKTLRTFDVKSIPVNFLIPIEGVTLKSKAELTPQYCLKILSLFRYLNPSAEVRASAGREYHLRKLEPLALYPANSLFLEGYLNVKGNQSLQTLKMIEDAGFFIASDFKMKDLFSQEEVAIKSKSELRPTLCE